jgi:hypothetical protein
VRNHSDYFSALWECLKKENYVAIVWMKGDNYATIEPPPNIDNQEDSKEHGLCKSLYEYVFTEKKLFFF